MLAIAYDAVFRLLPRLLSLGRLPGIGTTFWGELVLALSKAAVSIGVLDFRSR